MAHMHSTELADEGAYAAHRELLLATARSAIRRGLENAPPETPVYATLPPALRAHGACFVTLHTNHELRGCIGSLEAYRPLIEDLAANAQAAAFRDPRFAPVRAHEFERLDLHISILRPAQPLAFTSEQDLVQQLRPGIDGLILEMGAQRGTFLPSVWDVLPEPQQFLEQLKIKAGLSADYWSDAVRAWRYTTESIAEV